jgi:hypothetical protein
MKYYASAECKEGFDSIVENMIKNGYEVNGEVQTIKANTVTGEYVDAFIVEMKKNDK